VILGHSGFIGRYIEAELRVNYPLDNIVGISSRQVDLTCEKSSELLFEYLDNNTVLIVCSAIKKQLGDSLDLFNENVKMASCLAKILSVQTIKKLIYFSSTSVYGEDINNTHISESTLTTARTYYGASKIASEAVLTKVFAEHDNSQLVIIRAPLIYGHGDNTLGYGPTLFTHHAIGNIDITLWGDGEELREFIYVEDIAKIVSELVSVQFSGVLNTVSGQSYSFAMILKLLKDNDDFSFDINQKERSKSKIDHAFCAARFYQLLPTFQFTPLSLGLEKTIARTTMEKGIVNE